MFGLVILGIAALYLALMYFVMRWAWRKGRDDGGSAGKGVLFAALGFLAVYLPVFGSYIPVLLKHRSLCAKDAGFTVYVPKEQWVAKNHGAIDKLSKDDVLRQERSTKSETTVDGFNRRLYFGGLLAWEWGRASYQIYNLKVTRLERRIRDAQTNHIMAVFIDYSAVNWASDNPIGWIFPDSCFGGEVGERPEDKWSEYFSFKSHLKGEDK